MVQYHDVIANSSLLKNAASIYFFFFVVKLEFVVFKVNFSGEINYSELYFLCDGEIL